MKETKYQYTVEQLSLIGREFYFDGHFHIVKEVKITEKDRTFLISDSCILAVELSSADFTVFHIIK